ncbi:MAG: rhodanese-like domain-containing protein [Sulfurovum sp.]|nr:rhodanese-like domain-containing protein [Sulfurovum sp.]
MFKLLCSLCLLSSPLVLASALSFEQRGVTVTMKDKQGKPYEMTVKRDKPKECEKVRINNATLWTGDFAHASVPDACKSTYVHTKGKLLPMHLESDLETYGELEVLLTLKEMKTNPNLVLIDSRKKDWFIYRTIPGAINMPFDYFKEREEYEFEFEFALKHLGAIKDADGDYEFDHVKTLVIFCNGPWCRQSPDMIFALIDAGYPTEKLKWYRGGMQDWLSAGMTSTRP